MIMPAGQPECPLMPVLDPDSRHQRIVDLVRERGFVANEELARLFEVTVQTVRRDVNHLADRGRIARHHGGAGNVSSVENLAYDERQVLNGAEKRLIARQVASAIPDGSSLFLNIGTTIEAVARALLGHQHLSIITNNLNVAMLLSRQSAFQVTVVGGSIRNRDGGIVGASAASMIAEYRVDYGIIGTSGIDDDGTLLDFDQEEIVVARAILRNARNCFLVADHTKFGRRPMRRLASLHELSAVFTDRTPPVAIIEAMAQAGVALHVADR